MKIIIAPGTMTGSECGLFLIYVQYSSVCRHRYTTLIKYVELLEHLFIRHQTLLEINTTYISVCYIYHLFHGICHSNNAEKLQRSH